ncbi:MAG TPA: TIGR03086 family metal-binding protein [Actinomycetota bacterium]
MDTVGLFKRAAGDFRMRLQKVTDWTVPTPCTEWDARALVNHVINEVMWVPLLVEGKTIEQVGSSLDGDLLGDDALAAWDAAVASAIAEISKPDAMQRVVHLSMGETPADEYVNQVASDLAIHMWDVARAVGADERIDPELVALAAATFGPMFDGARKAGVFADEVLVPDDADPQTKLLAMSGRSA